MELVDGFCDPRLSFSKHSFVFYACLQSPISKTERIYTWYQTSCIHVDGNKHDWVELHYRFT